MPTKKVDDADYWKARRGRFEIPELPPSANPAVLPSEDPAAFDALTAEYYARFQPARPEERCYVDDIIYCEWMLRRLRRTEIELNTFVYEHASHTHPDYPMGQPAAERPRVFTALGWRMISTRKALREAFASLRELRANPIPEIGFVPETLPPVPPPTSRDREGALPTLTPTPPAPPSPSPRTATVRERSTGLSTPGTPANAPLHRPSPITE
uniref:Uncharacterized protein n=1 Tax=Solibacter usitatus (strain Ellin6076) TaxID=234267 RepID=Q01Y12_SOLUE